MTSIEVKNRVLEWMAKRPDAAKRAVSKLLLSNEGTVGLARLMRLIGLDEAWQLFDFLSPESRTILEHHVRQTFDQDGAFAVQGAEAPLLRLLDTFEREALERESASGSPFWFISSWSAEQLTRSVRGISGQELALLAHFSDSAATRTILSVLDTANRAALLLAKGRLTRLPPTALESAAIQLAEKMLARDRKEKDHEKQTVSALDRRGLDGITSEERTPEAQVWQELIQESLGDRPSPQSLALVSKLERLQQQQAQLETEWEWDSLAENSISTGSPRNLSKLQN
ncbi:MAG: hypothetical protein KGQ59_09270 [Bdellovibrionales bacterium]|nr:hypothetical protein [Bdellovibrionales bacterium]